MAPNNSDFFAWLLVWSFMLSMCWFMVERRPFGANYFSSSSIPNVSASSDGPFPSDLQGTNITARTSIISFRRYLRCISESGRWAYDPTPRHIPWNYVGHRFSTRCDEEAHSLRGESAERASNTAQNWTVRETLKWVWVTDEACPILPTDRDEFCKLIGKRGNIMIVGDSINQQIRNSIINSLIKDPHSQEIRGEGDDCRQCRGFPMCGDVLGTGRGFDVSFVRNDRLSMVEKPEHDLPVGNYLEWPWKDLIKEWNVKTLLINRGAHYEPDEILLNTLNSTFTYLKNSHPDLFIVYRNTPPGHVNCTLQTPGPLEKRQNLTLASMYHWGEFQRQNRLVKVLVERFGFIHMDIDTMISLRPDGHLARGDCLHYCVPGPLDTAVQLLYNIMKAIPRFSH